MGGFYNPYMKGPDFAGGISDMVGKMLQMLMMKQMFSQDEPPGAGASGQEQLGGPQRQVGGQMLGGPPSPQGQGQGGGVPPGMASGQMRPPMPTMGAGPPGMAQAGMGRDMTQQLMMALQNNPQLMQMLMSMMRSPGVSTGMGGGLR